MKKQNIRVQRYTPEESNVEGARCDDGTFAWEASVEPDDKAWCLFVPTQEQQAKGMAPLLYINVGTVKAEDVVEGEIEGDECAAYVPAGSPEHRAYIDAMK